MSAQGYSMATSSKKMTWHLATDEQALKLIDFEFLMWRTYYSWIRWQEDCQAAIASDELSAPEIAILHIIRMSDRAKTVYEIARLLNRDDIANIQYGAKKLIGLGYVEKVDDKTGPKRAITYKITEKGIENAQAYAKAREDILIRMIERYDPDSLRFEDATKILSSMKGVYEEASRLTASYKESNEE